MMGLKGELIFWGSYLLLAIIGFVLVIKQSVNKGHPDEQ